MDDDPLAGAVDEDDRIRRRRLFDGNAEAVEIERKPCMQAALRKEWDSGDRACDIAMNMPEENMAGVSVVPEQAQEPL
jgi:hypothetical protein